MFNLFIKISYQCFAIFKVRLLTVQTLQRLQQDSRQHILQQQLLQRADKPSYHLGAVGSDKLSVSASACRKLAHP